MWKRSQLIVSIVTNIIIILIISKVATKSLNPLAVFHGDSLGLKLVIGFFLLGIGASIFGLMWLAYLQDKRCAVCGLSLTDLATARGNPVKCGFCQRWYHANCLASKGGAIFGGCKQPGCPSAPEGG